MMKKAIWLIIGLSYALLPFNKIRGQQFTFVEGGFAGVGRSSLGWADYDLDGDLDLLLTGNQGSGPYVASVYRNDLGVFQNINAGLTGIDNSSVAWGDFDNDGDPDIICTGRSTGSTITRLYRNDSGVFVSVNNPFPSVGSYSSVAWSDIEGDGDLDVVVSGNYTSNLYLNHQGVFSNSGSTLPAVSNSSVTIGDYDNDGDQDIFIMGDAGGWPISAICRNDGGFFTEFDTTGIKPLSSGSASWCDYDHDKDLDLLLSGFDQYLEPQTSIFRNDGSLTFTDIRPDLADAALGSSIWGDYDNDGDADILITGQNAACGSLSSLVYRNDGNDLFVDINESLEGAERGCSAWADYDNDGDLDLIISGFNGYGIPSTRLYRNEAGSNSYTAMDPPTTPSELQTEVNGHTANFFWRTGEDNLTPSPGITYNLRVGTAPGIADVLSSSTDLSGYRLVPLPGNIGNDTTWSLLLPDGIYYWSVQSIDHGLATSDFSPDQEIEITNVGIELTDKIESYLFYPNPFMDFLVIPANTPCRIYNLQGKVVHVSVGKLEEILSTDHWSPGIYFIKTEKSTPGGRTLIRK